MDHQSDAVQDVNTLLSTALGSPSTMSACTLLLLALCFLALQRRPPQRPRRRRHCVSRQRWTSHLPLPERSPWSLIAESGSSSLCVTCRAFDRRFHHADRPSESVRPSAGRFTRFLLSDNASISGLQLQATDCSWACTSFLWTCVSRRFLQPTVLFVFDSTVVD